MKQHHCSPMMFSIVSSFQSQLICCCYIVAGQTLLAEEQHTQKYTVGHKKRDTFIFVITQTNIDRFS